MRSNSQFLGASVNEFIQIWALGGDANLNLSTHEGRTTVSFNCTIGQPGAPHSLPPFHVPTPAPSPPPHRPRHRGPAERERNRLRAARHQAAQAGTTAPGSSDPPVLLSTASATPPAAVISAAPLPDAEPVPVPVKSPFTVPVTFQLPAKESSAPVSDQVNPTSFFNIGSVKSTQAPKPPAYVPGTEYSRANYSRPGNAPSPPPCEKCGNPTYWSTSRVRQDMGWLHEYVCLCLTRKCFNTPPIS